MLIKPYIFIYNYILCLKKYMYLLQLRNYIFPFYKTSIKSNLFMVFKVNYFINYFF